MALDLSSSKVITWAFSARESSLRRRSGRTHLVFGDVGLITHPGMYVVELFIGLVCEFLESLINSGIDVVQLLELIDDTRVGCVRAAIDFAKLTLCPSSRPIDVLAYPIHEIICRSIWLIV